MALRANRTRPAYISAIPSWRESGDSGGEQPSDVLLTEDGFAIQTEDGEDITV